MGVDTSVLDTSKAVAPDLAWSLAGDAGVLDFPLEPRDAEPGARYSWWSVCRRAVLLMVVAAALAAGLVFGLRGWHESAPITAAPQSPSADSDPFSREEAGLPFRLTPYGAEGACISIAGGTTPEQLEAQMVAAAWRPVTLEEARDYVNAAIRTHCPEKSGLAGARS